jgi:hypothetical protein
VDPAGAAVRTHEAAMPGTRDPSRRGRPKRRGSRTLGRIAPRRSVSQALQATASHAESRLARRQSAGVEAGRGKAQDGRCSVAWPRGGVRGTARPKAEAAPRRSAPGASPHAAPLLQGAALVGQDRRFDLSLRECIGPRAEGEPRQAVLHRPSPQPREGQRDLVCDPPGLEQAAAISGGPRRHDAERHETPDPFRPAQREKKADPAASVMANQIDPVQPELVEQRKHVLGHRLAVVSLGPAPRSSQTRGGPGTAPGPGERAAASPDATDTSAAASRGASRSACLLPPRPGASAGLPR